MAKVNPVQGYMYQSVVDEDPRNETVCKIISRVESDADSLAYGPCFLVEFGDGEQLTAYAQELRPWFQTE